MTSKKGLHGVVPFRSTSLPAEKAHPIATSISGALDNIRFLSEHPPRTANAAAAALAGLSSLCFAVDEFLRLPTSQRAVSRGGGSSDGAAYVEEALEGYVQLLDSCIAARDAILITKDHAMALDSALRRRGADAAAVLRYVEEYVQGRRKATKAVVGFLKKMSLNKTRCQHRRGLPLGEGDREAFVLAGTLREVCAAAASLLGSVLQFLSLAASPSNGNRWGLLVTQYFAKGRSSSIASKQRRQEQPISDVELADAAVAQLRSKLRSSKGCTSPDVVRTAQMRLKALEAQVDRLESAVDVVYMGLIRNRVTLLNVISP